MEIQRKPEGKTDWLLRRLGGATEFVHCSGVRPDQVRARNGFDPEMGREEISNKMTIESDEALPDDLHHFVFACVRENNPDGSVKIPKIARKMGFSAGCYVYVFTAPLGTRYASTRGVLRGGIEIGFPDLVDYRWITTVYKADKRERLQRIGTFDQALGGGARSWRCYITTAVCESLALGDDCEELQTLRWFRDQVLARDATGRREIEVYYRTAPRIVAAIDASPARDAVYRDIHRQHLVPAVRAVREGRYDDAHRMYRRLVEQLSARWLAFDSASLVWS